MRWALLSVALSVMAGAHAAHAEPTPQEKILAQSLFDDGRAKMQAHDYAAACPKLAESYRLDAAPGTFLNLGLCHEAEGKLATAYAELSEALSRAIRDGRADRQKTAREHLAAIAPRLSKLKLSVGQGAPPDLHVEVDGIALARAAWDVAVPMDPGQHTIVASGSGLLPKQIPVTIAADGSTKEIEIGELEVDPNAHSVVVATPPPPVEPPKAPPPVEPPPSSSSPLRIVGFSSLAVGGAALIAGGIFGGIAASTWSSAKSECPGGACPTDAAVNDGRRAGTFADVATVSLVAGAVLAAAGLTLVLLAPSSKKPKSAGALSASAIAIVTATSAGVVVSGSF